MSKNLREALREIARVGGRNPVITHGGRHTLIHFTAINGETKQVTLSRGTNLKDFAVRRMRSQVRKQAKGKEIRCP